MVNGDCRDQVLTDPSGNPLYHIRVGIYKMSMRMVDVNGPDASLMS